MLYKNAYKTEEGKKAVISAYQAILKNWPVPYHELKITTSYGSTYVIECGDNSHPPLLLLHGTSSNSSMWIGEVAEYSRYYHVFAIDMPGEPGMSEEKQYSLKDNAYREWLAQVADSLNLTKFRIVGLSLGGWLSLNFAIHYPERVEALALLCPSGIGEQRASFMLKALFCMLQGERGYDRLARVVGGSEVPSEAVEYMKLISKNFYLRTEPVPIYSDEELRRLSMPVMVLVGEKDVLLNSSKTASRVKTLLPHSEVEILKGSGHVLINLADKVLEFLGRL